MKSIIHVNQQIIAHNRKHGTAIPPLTVKQGGKARYGQEVIMKGVSKVVHSPHKPLSCGARVWIETHDDIEIVGEVDWNEVKEMKKVVV